MSIRRYEYVSAVLLLAGVMTAGVGCSDSNTHNVYNGTTSVGVVSGEAARIEVTLEKSDYQRITGRKRDLEISLYDDRLESCYQKTFKCSDLSKNVISLDNIPLGAKYLVAISRDKYNNIAISDSVNLELVSGATTKVSNLNLHESSAELREIIVSLTVNGGQPLTTKVGGIVQAKVEVELALRNGIKMKQDLTKSSRLIWKSSNRSVLISQGNGVFKSVSSGPVKILASFCGHEAELDVIVNPVLASSSDVIETPKVESEPEVKTSESEVETAEVDRTETTPSVDTGSVLASDPTLTPDPVPIASDSSLCTLKIEPQGDLPEGLSCEIRAYDEDNQLRFIEKDVRDLSSLKVSRDSVVVAGIYTRANGELYGLFEEKLENLGDSYQLTPEIVSGPRLAARSELVVGSSDPVYDLSTLDSVYSEESEDAQGNVVRSVNVYCETSVITDIISGVWGYETPASFLQELCTFDADGADMQDKGVFKFFGVGSHTINVSYQGLSASFRVVVTDPSVITKLNLNFNSILTSGRYCQLRGYNSQGLVWQSSSNITQNSTITQSDDNNIDSITKLVGVIFDSNDEPCGMFENSVSINRGETNNFTPSGLITGTTFAQRKGSFTSFWLSKTSVDLTNSNSGYVYTFPTFTYNIYNGWNLNYTYNPLAYWNDFALIINPPLEIRGSCKSDFNVYKKDVGTHTVQASYKGVKSEVKSVEVVVNSVAPYSVKLNLSNLPSGTSSIKTQLYKDGTALGSENSHTSGSSFTYSDTSKDANYIVVMVRDSSGHLIGLGGGNVTYNSSNAATVNVSMATGSSMNSYIESLTVSPVRKKLAVNSTINGQANATLTFNSGRIKKNLDASSDVTWSSSDMSQVSGNRWKVTKAGQSSLKATLGSKTGTVEIYASGTDGNVKYGYTEMNVGGKTIVVDVPATEKTGTVINDGKFYTHTYNNGSMSADVYGDSSNVNSDIEIKSPSLNASLEISDSPVEVCGLSLRNSIPRVAPSEQLRDRGIKSQTDANLTPGQQYKGCRPGDIITNLYANGYFNVEQEDGKIERVNKWYTLDAKVLIGDVGNDADVPSDLIVLSALKDDGTPVININQAKTTARYVSISNPLDPDNMSVLERDRATFGSESDYGKNIPVSEKCIQKGLYANGLNGTGKLIILFTRPETMYIGGLSFVGGYFSPNDLVPRNMGYYVSNETKMITINPSYIIDEDNYGNVLSTIAHEFQHYLEYDRFVVQGYDLLRKYYDGEITYSQFWDAYDYRANCYDACTNTNEAFSGLAQTLVGCSADSREISGICYDNSSFINKASTFISGISNVNFKTGFKYSDRTAYGSPATYGRVLTFSNYLYDKHGTGAITEYFRLYADAISNNEIPNEEWDDKYFDIMAQAVSNVSGKQYDFGALYTDFCTTLLLSQVDNNGNRVYKNVPSEYTCLQHVIPGSKHGYYTINSITPKQITGAYSVSNLVPWTGNYFSYDATSTANNNIFSFSTGLDSVFKLIWFSQDGSNLQYSGLE